MKWLHLAEAVLAGALLAFAAAGVLAHLLALGSMGIAGP